MKTERRASTTPMTGTARLAFGPYAMSYQVVLALDVRLDFSPTCTRTRLDSCNVKDADAMHDAVDRCR